jgi:hypothetical protein
LLLSDGDLLRRLRCGRVLLTDANAATNAEVQGYINGGSAPGQCLRALISRHLTRIGVEHRGDACASTTAVYNNGFEPPALPLSWRTTLSGSH